MSNLEYIILALATSITIYGQLKSCGNLKLSSRRYNLVSFMLIIASGVLITLNSYNVNGFSRFIISFGFIFFCALYIYKDSLINTFIYLSTTYILLAFFEIILSSILILFNYTNISMFDTNVFFKVAFSFLTMTLSYFSSKLKFIRIFVEKAINLLSKYKYSFVYFVITLLFLSIIDYAFYASLDFEKYFINIIVVICFFIILTISIYNYVKARNEIHKSKILLESFNDYEKKIDDDRMDRHEILNNLLILKSFKNKNSNDYNNLLDDLIDNYSKKSVGIKNIYKLPSGLKGILYYKIYGNKSLKTNIHISKNMMISLESINKNDYVLLCRIVSITLDNAIEACQKSKDKLLNIDIYNEKNNIIIMIENTYSNKVDMNKIYNKKYTSKKKGGGFGLYIAKLLLKNNDNVILEQYKDDIIFTTKISVK